MRVGECNKCQIPIAALHPNKTGIPTYIQFPSSYFAEKQELENLYHFTDRGYIIVFNDSLDKHFEKTSTSQVILLAGRDVLYRNTILNIQPAEIERIIALDRDYLGVTAAERESLRFDGEEPLRYDYVFHRLSSGLRKSTDYYITVEDFARQRVYDRCTPWADVNQYKDACKSDGTLKPFIAHYRSIGRDSLLAAIKYYEVGEAGGRPRMGPAIAIARYEKGKLKVLTPVIIDWKMEHSSGGQFIPLPDYTDDSLILCFYPINVSKTPDSNNRFLAVFENREGCYHFKRFLSPQVTEDYRLHFGRNLLDIHAQDDRYVAPLASNEVIDFIDEVSYIIPFDSIVTLGKRDMRGVMEGKGVPLRNLKLAHVDALVFLFSQLNGTNYIVCYNVKTQRLRSYHPMENLFPNSKKVTWGFDMLPSRSSIFISKTGEKSRIFPFELLYSQ